MARKRQMRSREADPTTYAAFDAAKQAGADRYGTKLGAVYQRIKTFLAGRSSKDLTDEDAVTFMSLKAEFDALAIEQKRYTEAVVDSLLNPDGGGSEIADA